MHDDITAARRAIAALAPSSKYNRRYPAQLRARLLALVRAHAGERVGSLARSLDMAPQTLAGIASSLTSTALVPVHIVEDPVEHGDVRVVGPRGIVVEGLGIDGVAALIRALS